jgi:epoxide hydrolase-like predicted phosphatase
MVKAVIFDCFGVLTTSGFRVFRDKYFEGDSKKHELALDLMSQQNLGLITYKDLIKKVSRLANVTEEKVKEYMDENKANEPLFDFIREQLKPKYKIGLLSNAGDNWLSELFNKKEIELFDDVILSYKVGLIKPDPNIYIMAAKRLGLEPEECVFIDDNPGHCSAAREVGMKAIVYSSFPEVKNNLQKLLSSASNN